MRATLFYVHDPMCSWCWAFERARNELLQQLPDDVDVVRLLGGLAEDSDAIMQQQMSEYIQANWHSIESKLPHVRFNYDFWKVCLPRRATYPACRAVISARAQGMGFDQEMTAAIQKAYYQQARNPSETAVLIDLAAGLGLDVAEFSKALSANSTQQMLLDEIAKVRQMSVDSYPAAVLQVGASYWRLPIDYKYSHNMLQMILTLLDE